ncbi:hypothetical protein BIY21_02935 [Vibrio ponticus]|uniref:TlpA family protein disulfide reductase n=1 Tax=Vibrio ponticus TaxID=265668 RepID=A0A3N3E628_9VIBR|nr:TlpA disulfide reductase family protein [Vibrio ponticus]OLQ89077.1 hypothetical protein BIY21_02935 [Vibrio ponticus]ROV62196.1 TlpA family protein disulfide reductase [Vibrio ponticus]
MTKIVTKLTLIIVPLLTAILQSNTAYAQARQCAAPPPFESTQVELANLPYQLQNNLSHAPVSMLNLWAIWCAPCRKELPMLVELAAQVSDEVAVSALHVGKLNSQVEQVLTELDATSLNRGFLADFSLLTEHGIHGLPATVVAVNGKVQFIATGYLARSAQEYSTWLECLKEHKQ